MSVVVSRKAFREAMDWWDTNRFREDQSFGLFPVLSGCTITWVHLKVGDWRIQGRILPPDAILSPDQELVEIPADSGGWKKTQIFWNE